MRVWYKSINLETTAIGATFRSRSERPAQTAILNYTPLLTQRLLRYSTPRSKYASTIALANLPPHLVKSSAPHEPVNPPSLTPQCPDSSSSASRKSPHPHSYSSRGSIHPQSHSLINLTARLLCYSPHHDPKLRPAPQTRLAAQPYSSASHKP